MPLFARQYLAGSFYLYHSFSVIVAQPLSFLGLMKRDKVDSLFREWLSNEPDWGWGYIGWSDLYWLWNPGNEKDFAKAESILREGLSIPNVRDHEHINDRLDNLQKENKSAQKSIND